MKVIQTDSPLVGLSINISIPEEPVGRINPIRLKQHARTHG
jgi:hypothetical protein